MTKLTSDHNAIWNWAGQKVPPQFKLPNDRAINVLYNDTNRVSGISASKQTNAATEIFEHLTNRRDGQTQTPDFNTANIDGPICEYLSALDASVGFEQFYYMFSEKAEAIDGYLQSKDNTPSLGNIVTDKLLSRLVTTE